jgi:adenosylmethionine---8-amino-7-oxononanoate aminotransferase
MKDLLQRDRAHIWHPYTQEVTAPPRIPLSHAEGVWLYSQDGRRILDGISSWWVNIHGHGHPSLIKALTRQAEQLEHAMFAGFTHEPAVALAEKLIAVLPQNITRIFYSDNGSTAVEVALKMALQYWSNIGQPERKLFVVLQHAYHGDTVGAMSASADSAFTQPFQSFLFQVARVHAPYCYRCPVGLTRPACSIDCLQDLESVLKQNQGRIAGVLVEPMLQGAGGMIVWPQEFLQRARALCNQYETLLIADEVLTGFGRTGRMFACEHAGVAPDIICLSKALTAGYLPLGVTATTDAVYEAFLSTDRTRTFFHGHSYTANPLACAVGSASLDLFRTENTLDQVVQLSAWLQTGLEQFRAHPNVGDVRVIGGVGVLELVQDQQTKQAGGYLDQVGQDLYVKFIERGLLLRPLGNIVYVMPPYVISRDEMNWLLAVLADVLTDWRWP